MDSDGDFVVVWQSYGSSGGDTSYYSIQAQRYNSAGTAQASQFQVNSYTTNWQSFPAVAMNDSGDFVVVWQSFGSGDTDTSNYSIQAQRYNSLGTSQLSQFQVNSYTTSSQSVPAVAMTDYGNFIVVWQSFGSGSTDTDGDSIQAQRYNTVGTAQGGQVQINSYTTNYQRFPAIAMDSDGDLIIVWHSNGSGGTDTSGDSVQARRYNNLLTPFGSQFQVNGYTTNTQQFPAVSLDNDGDFVVAWESNGSDGGDGSSYSIQAQRYNSLATAQGSQFQVNSDTTNAQRWPTVAMDSDGDFVVVWHSDSSSGGDTSYYSIQAQRYNRLATAQGLEFQVNSYTTNQQRLPAVAMDSDGDFVVVWNSNGSIGNNSFMETIPDTSDYSIQAARFNTEAGPVPTALALQSVGLQPQLPFFSSLLAGLGAILSGAWLWLRRRP